MGLAGIPPVWDPGGGPEAADCLYASLPVLGQLLGYAWSQSKTALAGLDKGPEHNRHREEHRRPPPFREARRM